MIEPTEQLDLMEYGFETLISEWLERVYGLNERTFIGDDIALVMFDLDWTCNKIPQEVKDAQ